MSLLEFWVNSIIPCASFLYLLSRGKRYFWCLYVRFFKKKPVEKKSLIPEVLGLRLGGVIELDALKMKIIEPDLTISGAAKTQLIQAVGVVQLDNSTRLIRYYTDDEAMVQILMNGESDADVQQCMLSYYYSTTPIDTDMRWNDGYQKVL